MNGISVITITFNEEKNIKDFIISHKTIADEIIVIDSGSTDCTVDIAKSLGCNVVYNPWTGFSEQWNKGINLASYEWILVGDADHRLTDELKEFLYNLKLSSIIEYDGFFVPRRNIYFGKWIRHGGVYPDTPYPRLFRSGLGRFDEKIFVHEKIVFTGRKIGITKGDILHLSYLDIDSYIKKMNLYTSLEAKQRKETKNKYHAFCTMIKEKRLDKSVIRRVIPCRWLVVFLWRYIFKLGFLDGKIGFHFAVLSAIYEYFTDLKVWTTGK